MRTDWPNQAQVAVSLTFDVDAESGWLGEDPAYEHRLSTLSEARFGVTRGVPRILEILAKHEIKGTFYIPGYTAERHPDAIKRIARRRPRDRPPRLPAPAQRRDHAKPSSARRSSAGSTRSTPDRHARSATAARAGSSRPRRSQLLKRARLRLRQQPDGRRSPVRPRRPARAARALEPRRLAAPALEAGTGRRVHRARRPSSTPGSPEFDSARQDRRHVTYTMHPEVIGRGYRAQLLDRLIAPMTERARRVVRDARAMWHAG